MAIKENKKREDKREIVIRVEGLSKTFRIPHEKHTSLKSAALNIFDKKNYEEFTALKNVSLEIKKGEFFGIIGRNGSGKSTLLKILAGIYMPDEGKVDIKGKLSPFLELGVGFNPELTGRENLFLGGSILGLTRKEIAEKFDKIVDFSEIGEFIDMKMKNYSSGMQVRLAFSLAINAHAEILLMDEVLAVGDSNFQSKCIEEFNKYRTQGKTVILVTHDIGTIQKYCDRAMLLRNGKVQKIGKAEDVGNEYIYQNMEEEEKRARDKEKKNKNSSKNKIIAIKKVELRDLSKKCINTLKTHSNLEIRIFFDVSKNMKDDINVGLSLENGEGQYLFGYSTLWDNYEPDLSKGYISVVFPELPLLKGKYFVNITFVRKKDEKILDYKKRIASFKVFSLGGENSYKGNLYIDHKWEQ